MARWFEAAPLTTLLALALCASLGCDGASAPEEPTPNRFIPWTPTPTPDTPEATPSPTMASTPTETIEAESTPTVQEESTATPEGEDDTSTPEDDTPTTVEETPTPNVIIVEPGLQGLPEFEGDRTVGTLVNLPGAAEGYTLISPEEGNSVWLIDLNGRVVNAWENLGDPGMGAYLGADGTMLRAVNPEGNGAELSHIDGGGGTGRIEAYSWEGELVWSFELVNETSRLHHDLCILPNGNVLVSAWEVKTEAEALAAGRKDIGPSWEGEMWPDTILELSPKAGGEVEVVWEWKVWDHLIQDKDPSLPNYGVVRENPGRIDINIRSGSGPRDFTHVNSISYNAELDQILLSAHSLNEVWIIDHGTTTQEAAGFQGGRRGRGGDLLYRWGNPETYDRFESSSLWGQHDADWIPTGPGEAPRISIFNNGLWRPDLAYSSVDEITLPILPDGTYYLDEELPYGPEALSWSYVSDPPEALLASFGSGSQRLWNGNTLIIDGPEGLLFEITPSGAEVWRYVVPIANNTGIPQGEQVPLNPQGPPSNALFKADRYPPTHPAFIGRDLTPGPTLETY